MALPAQKLREIVLQLLYSEDIANQDDNIIQMLMQELAISKKHVKSAFDRVSSIKQKFDQIDPMITAASVSYDFNRIQLVTKNILRLALYEIFFDTEIPDKVAISEAIRLSRKFATPESAKFVNALLDYLYKKKIGEAPLNEDFSHQAESLLAEEPIPPTILQPDVTE